MKASPDDMEIERFLDGRMTPEERTAFQDRVEREPRLRETVRAERAIREAMSRQAQAIRPDHAALRAQLLGKVAATAPALQAGGSAASAILGSAFAKGVMGIVAAGLLAVGTIFFWPEGGERGAAPAATGSAPAPSHVRHEAPGPAPAEHADAAVVKTDSVLPAVDSNVARHERVERAGRNRKQNPSHEATVPAVAEESDNAAEERATVSKTTTLPREEGRAPVSFRNDSLRTRVKVEIEKP